MYKTEQLLNPLAGSVFSLEARSAVMVSFGNPDVRTRPCYALYSQVGFRLDSHGFGLFLCLARVRRWFHIGLASN